MMNKKQLFPLWPIFALLVALLFAFFSADASGQEIADRVEGELVRTDRLIDDARSRLMETSNIKAEELVRQATNIQAKAWEAYFSHHPIFAAQLSAKARNLATRAIGLLQRRQEDHSFVEKEIERTDDLLEKVRARIAEANVSRPFTLFDTAVRFQDKAKEMFSEKRLKQALSFTLRSRKIVQRLIGEYGNRERHRKQTEKLMARVGQLVERSAERVQSSGDESIVALFERGVIAYERARELSVHDRWVQANRLLTNAAGDINRAIRRLEGEDGSVNAERALQLAEQQLTHLTEKAAELGTDVADNLITEAGEKLEKAYSFFEQGKYDRVLIIIRVVMELEQQAAKILGEW